MSIDRDGGGKVCLQTHGKDLQAKTSTGLRLTVRRMSVRRFESRVILCVRFTDGRSVTLNIARVRVADLVDLLGQWT